MEKEHVLPYKKAVVLAYLLGSLQGDTTLCGKFFHWEITSAENIYQY